MSHAHDFELRREASRLRRRVTWDGGVLDRPERTEGEEHAHATENHSDGQTTRLSGQGIQPATGHHQRVTGEGRDTPASAGSWTGAHGWQGTLPLPSHVGSTQIRRITEAWDETLLERTQVRHLLDTLRTSREFLESTLQSLDSWPARAELHAAQSADRSTADGFAGHPDHRTSPTDPVSIDPTDDLKTPPTARPVEVSTVSGSDKVQSPSYGSLLAQFRQDYARVRGLERDFSLALESLSNREYHMNAKQTALVNDLKDPTRAAGIINQIANDHQASLEASEAARSADHLPSVVEEYFDKRGDVGVWQDRLEELMDAWAEGINERAFIADRGDPLEVTDEAFHKNYEDRRTFIETELAGAHEEADRLRELCRRAGHDVEQYRTARRSETASDASEPPLAPQHPFSEPLAQDELIPAADVTERRPPERRIDTWLRAVSPDDNEPAGDADVLWSAPETPLPDANAVEQPLPPPVGGPELALVGLAEEDVAPQPSALPIPEETNWHHAPRSTVSSAAQSYSIQSVSTSLGWVDQSRGSFNRATDSAPASFASGRRSEQERGVPSLKMSPNGLQEISEALGTGESKTTGQVIEKPAQPSFPQSQGRKTKPQGLDFHVQKTSYFKTYQVFQIYWHENTGEMADSVMASNTSISFSRTHGETIYSKTRRMIVVARLSRHCLCVPIQTYRKQGTSKPGIVPEHHAIVYTGDIPPEPLSSEVESGQYEKMKPPIRITPDIPTSMLDPESRVNFSELYTVHIYSKVKPFGYVAEDLRWQLDLTRHQVFERIFPPVPRGLASSQPTAPLDSANAKSGPNKGKRRRRRRTTKEAGEVTNQATRGSEPGRIDGIG